LRRAYFSKDVSKLVATIANYASKFSFTAWTPCLEGEEVFGFAKQSADFSPRVDDESHRPNHVNFSHPRVVIPTCHPNNVGDLHIHGSPCVAQNMFLIFSQGGIVVNEVMCGDDLWHFD
jgi:hypothetical protein